MSTPTRPRVTTFVAALVSLAVLGVFVAAAFGAFDAKNGPYAGTTSQGEPVSFKVKNDKVKHPKFKIQLGGCTVEISTTATGKISDSGKFNIAMPGGDFLKGKFVSKKKVTGKAHAQPVGCPSGTVSYTARHQ